MIEIKNLTFGYRKSPVKIFDNFSLNLEPGRVYGLLGRNGAGKSTLIYLMTGLLTPTSGVVELDGVNVRLRKPSTLADIFVVPEEFELPAVTLKQFVDTNAPFYPKFSADALKAYLDVFEIGDMNVNLKNLSMGQKKKVFMSFALATNTRVIVMDEPTNGLDIPSKSQFRKIVTRSMADDKIIVLSTHQVRDVDSVLDHVLIVDGCRALLNASINEVAEKLAFRIGNVTDDALYWQPSIGGNYVVAPNTTGEETNVDIEMLFNAVMTAPDRINAIFNNK